MVVVDTRQEGLTWVWLDTEVDFTARSRTPAGTFTRLSGRDETGRHITAELRDDEIIQTITQGTVRGILMNRVTAMLNGLHAG